MSESLRSVFKDSSGRVDAFAVYDETLLRAATALVVLSCGRLEGQRTVIAFDHRTDPGVLASIHQVCCSSGEAIVWDSGSFWKPEDGDVDDSSQGIPGCNLLIDLGSDYLLHAPALQQALDGVACDTSAFLNSTARSCDLTWAARNVISV